MFTADNLKSFLGFSSFVSVSSFFFFNYSIATDLLTPTTPLTDGQTLVSSGDKFELGFFSPSSSNSRYLGIWYKQSPKTVVWVANRNYPVIGSGGVLRIGDGGQLILMNQTQHVLWSSNSSKLGQDPRAQLLDVGNFVVMDGRNSISSTSGSYLWESFDHPTDTTLPGSRIGRDLGQGPDIFLTSWKSPSDPSPGDFLYRFKYRGLSELVIYQGSVKTFRSGPWNGVAFSGVSPPNKFGSFIMNFHDSVLYNFYLMRTYNNTDTTTRIVLTPSGSVDWLMLDEGTNQWKLLHTSPGDLCQNYGRCGINSICRVSKGFVCDCLKGFTPKVEQKWDLLDWSDGCVRKVALNCSNQDGFFKLVDVKLPELVEFRLDTSMDLQQCRAVCLKDCSCSAYANSNITQGGSGCVLWYGNLIDIMEFNQEGGEQAIFVRLAASELDSDGRINKKRFVMALAFSAASGLLILGLLLWCTTHMKQRNETGEDLLHFDLNVSLSGSREEQSEVKMMKANKTTLEIPLFSFSSVSAATNNFSPSNKLGEGGFGPVYKGILLNGQEVAIKRLSKRSTQGRDEWKNEAVLIAKLQHKNLVKLLGCCIEGDENLLVYEYLPNKSLDSLLFDSAKDGILDWATRVRIIEGIAQGLLYLHQYSRLTIIHRDLKASNILLDKDMNPKISDFGMARIFGGNQRGATRRIVGTYGYMAPEYALEGIFSVKSDVFSFGILLLEILSGKRNNSFYHNDFLNGRNDFLNLIGYAWDLWTRGKPLELKDPNLQETPCANIDSLLTRYIHVALLCVQQHPVERPKMSEVVLMFSNEQYSLPTPKPPAFSLLRSLVDPASQKTEADDCSANFGTTSVVEAR